MPESNACFCTSGLIMVNSAENLKQGNKVNLLGIFYNLIPSGEDRLLTTSPLLFFDGP
jgi:hypothetical protein